MSSEPKLPQKKEQPANTLGSSTRERAEVLARQHGQQQCTGSEGHDERKRVDGLPRRREQRRAERDDIEGL